METKILNEMMGKTMVKVYQEDDERLIFKADDGTRFVFYHPQGCCEHVYIEDICGSLDNLIGSPILIAEEAISENDGNPEGVDMGEYQDSYTWTFYKFATVKGHVTVRWYGSSNGYYGEGVDLEVSNGET